MPYNVLPGMKSLPDKLHWAVWALSRPMNEQVDLFPTAIPAAEELSLEFEEHLKPSIAEQGAKWSDLQKASLRDLDQQLSDMSGPDQDDLWLAEDSLMQPQWTTVRTLAIRVLEAFDLQDLRPTRNPTTYVTK